MKSVCVCALQHTAIVGLGAGYALPASASIEKEHATNKLESQAEKNMCEREHIAVQLCCRFFC